MLQVPDEPSDEEKHRVVKLKKLGNEILNVINFLFYDNCKHKNKNNINSCVLFLGLPKNVN